VTKIFGQEDDIVTGIEDVQAEVDNLDGDAMRGTDSSLLAANYATEKGTDDAALASVWTSALATVLANYTEIRAGYLDQLDFALQEAIAAIPTTMRGTDLALLAANYTTERGTDNALLAANYATERGTDSAALASVWTAALATALANYTEARAGYLDELAAANLPTDIDHLLLESEHETCIFPADTNLTCTLTAAATANTFGAWAEITDSGATTLGSLFTSTGGHLSSCIIEEMSEINTIYMLEVSYGESKTIISRARFAGTDKFQNPSHQERFRGVISPAGELIYYRMKSATAVADTALVHFRYHFHT